MPSNSFNRRPTQRAADLRESPRFSSIFLASSLFRFDGESTLRPQTATDNLQCQGFLVNNVLDDLPRL